MEKTEHYIPNDDEKTLIYFSLASSVSIGLFYYLVSLIQDREPVTFGFILMIVLFCLGWFLFTMLGVHWFLELHPEIKARSNKAIATVKAKRIKQLKPFHLDWIYRTKIVEAYYKASTFDLEKKESEKQ